MWFLAGKLLCDDAKALTGALLWDDALVLRFATGLLLRLDGSRRFAPRPRGDAEALSSTRGTRQRLEVCIQLPQRTLPCGLKARSPPPASSLPPAISTSLRPASMDARNRRQAPRLDDYVAFSPTPSATSRGRPAATVAFPHQSACPHTTRIVAVQPSPGCT